MAFNKGLPKPVAPEPIVAPVVAPEPVAVITDDDLLSNEMLSVEAEAKTLNAVASVIPAGGMMMDAAGLAAIIQAAVAGAQQAGNTGIAEQIAAGVSKALTGHMGVRAKTVAEIGEPKTPFNPTGRKREMECDFFQNGYPIMERYASDDEIAMLHQLVPGSYGPPDFPISVVKRERLAGGKPRVFINYGVSKDDRLREKTYGVNFHLFCKRLVEDAASQRAARRARMRAELAEDE